MTSNKLNDRLVLDLLDDQPDLRANSLDWAPKITATSAGSSSSATLPSTRTPASQQLAASRGSDMRANPFSSANLPNASTPVNQSKVFTQQRTLKDMMQEYNRRAPVSNIHKSGASGIRKGEFRFDSVEHIRLPEIPGKILRPA